MTDHYDIAYYLLQHGADYRRPLFYRPDYASPPELVDSTTKGEPVYLKAFLLEPQHSDIFTQKDIKKILDFLSEKKVN